MWQLTSAMFFGAAIPPGTKTPALNAWTMRIIQSHTQTRRRRFLTLGLTFDEMARPAGIYLTEVPYGIPENTVAVWELDDFTKDITLQGRQKLYYHNELMDHLSKITNQAVILEGAITNDPFKLLNQNRHGSGARGSAIVALARLGEAPERHMGASQLTLVPP
ncbi:unnamed protein product [Rhizoctonia solani]|uniref:Uncharacterized protein n=1 Tax=Rhizoctonia solani TaxID=456999 RepID=A0A8H3BK56_9AGAM|nr:unnamed protein product [Rhizoctonia solani]